MVHVVEQEQVGAELAAQPIEDGRDEVEIALGAPHRFRRQAAFRRLVGRRPLGDPVGVIETGDAALRADRQVAERLMLRHRREGVVERLAVGVRVDQDAVARRAAEELIHRHVQRLALDVPQRHVHGRDRRHRHRTAPPVGAFVEVLPGIFDASRVAPDQQRRDVIGEVARHRQLAAVHRRIAQPVDAVLGGQLERDEVAARRTDYDSRIDDTHLLNSQLPTPNSQRESLGPAG